MKSILSERNIVVVLFVMVLVTFSLAHEDSKKMEGVYLGTTTVRQTSYKVLNDIPTSLEPTAPIPATITE